ncbi:uncharacterized protein LOC122396969 [Colletes gigas]|uniref:uncharacterized protein LOC122396969 n=1 Tax=Colletes gigas TaxID=935657 RepID=UPI001C9A7ECA|nr:uncharacterized protein LOC122396969 [Colletes gigas]
MFGNVTPEKAVDFTRISVALNCSWPLPSTATRFQMLRFQTLRILAILSSSGLVLPLLYSVYVNHNDPVILTKAACMSVAVSQIPVQSCFCIAHYDRIQGLIEQMTDYCAKAKSYERRILQQYTNKYSMFYGVSATWFYLTAIAFIFGALFIEGAFPVDAEYPFPVNYEPMRTMIFLHQALVGLQCAAIVCVNMFAALLLLFASARFEILMANLRAVESIETLIECIQKYYDPQPLAVKVQFLFLALTALVEVFMCALPADNLMDVSANAIRSLYESLWYEQSVGVQKIVMYSLVPQKPIVVSIACIIPIMSLNYYCSYVANAFSIFTALRIVMTDDEDVNMLRETVNTTFATG